MNPTLALWAAVYIGLLLYQPVIGLVSLVIFTDFIVAFVLIGLIDPYGSFYVSFLPGAASMLLVIGLSKWLTPVANIILWFFSKATVLAYTIAFLLLVDFINQLPTLRSILRGIF